MKRSSGKSHCPINYGLETFGDPWSLLVVRDIVYFGKHTFNEFLASEEAIAPSVLSSRLEQLVAAGVLSKGKDPSDGRRVAYSLTEQGLRAIPILVEIADWGVDADPDTGAPPDWVAAVRADKPAMIERIVAAVRQGRAVFVGEDSLYAEVVRQAA
ncbi:winged helix-turn-helix transcriptional regulator [Microlunatus parietis]|uniref:DNA-binding HxlR family transcriptional regulator n=1 Tax=Microlunatus parietis TaxID=682979 RepID=A0A7Y9IA42_9ACTN|nr:helix-turn-helix domain-containing protein [Microlunatus parietis]NYE73074.1 DNA-binding HxlR family transcriptional regulator [Microlunatus parietis]